MVRLGMGWAVLASVDAETAPHPLNRATNEHIDGRMLPLVRRSDRVPSPALATLLAELRSTAGDL